MKRFTDKGTMHIPKNTLREKKQKSDASKPVLLTGCYCPNGHSLFDEHTQINEHTAIKLRIENQRGGKGMLALSPVYGEHARVTFDIQIDKGDILDMYCPECNEPLKVYSSCSVCDSEMLTIFLTKENNYSDCVGVCKRVGCHNSKLVSSRRMLLSAVKNITK